MIVPPQLGPAYAPLPVEPQGPGREYTFGELLRIAWRQLRATWKQAVGYAVLILLITVGLIVVLYVAAIAGVLIGFATNMTAALWILGPVGVLLVLALFSTVILFEQGYLWSAVRSFDQDRMYWSDIMQPWRRPWLRPMVGYAVILAALQAAIWASASVLSFGITSSPLLGALSSIPAATGAAQVGQILLWRTVGIIVELATLLVGPMVLMSDRPRLFAAWREYVHLLRGQPKRLLAFVGLLAGLTTLLELPKYVAALALAGAGPTASPARLLLVGATSLYCPAAVLLFGLAYNFVYAALLRAAYGLPLTPTGPAQRSAVPLAPLRLAGDVRSARPNAWQKAAGVGDSSDDPPAPDGSATGEPATGAGPAESAPDAPREDVTD